MKLVARTTSACSVLTLLASASLLSCCPCRFVDQPTATAAEADAEADVPVLPKAVPYQWRSVITLGGGFVTGIIFHPTEKGLMYARTDIGGAYRWNPADDTWIPITDMFGPADSNLKGIESLALDPKDPNLVYIAAGTYVDSWAGDGAILRSNDRGQSWERFSTSLRMGGNQNGRSNGERMVVDPNDRNIILFGTRINGLQKSTNRGESFEPVKGFPKVDDPEKVGITFVTFDAASGTEGKPTPTIYAGWASTKEPALYRSQDAGETWAPVPGAPKGVMPSHAEFDKNGTLYLTFANAPGPGDQTTGSVWKLDKGDKWTNITPLVPNDAPNCGDKCDKFGYGGLTVAFDKPGTVMVTTLDRWSRGDEIFRTEDGGKTWKPLAEKAIRDDAGAKYLYWGREKPSSVGWMGDIALDPTDPNHAFYVTGQGIWRSKNAGAAMQGTETHWKFEQWNFEETAVNDLASPPSGVPLLSMVGDLGGFRHEDLWKPPSGGMFQNPIFGNGHSIDFAEKAPSIVVRVGRMDKKLNGALSKDQGVTWKPFAAPMSGWGGQIALSADGKSFVWSPKDSDAVFSNDDGNTLKKVGGVGEHAKLADWAAVALKVASDRVNPKKFYAYNAKDGQALVSTDGGANFSVTYDSLNALPEYEMHLGQITTPFGIEGEIWVATGKDVFRSTDSGKTFDVVESIDTGSGIAFGKAAPGKTRPSVFLNGKIEGQWGFYRSDDDAKSWVRINDDQHQYGGATVITGDPRVYGRLYIGTHGRGIVAFDPK